MTEMTELPDLHNSLSRSALPGADPLTVLLYDRLKWLRNHYAHGRPEFKFHVLADIDDTLLLAEEATRATAAESGEAEE